MAEADPKTHFRSWRIPGPHPPAAPAAPADLPSLPLLPRPDETLDALSGHFKIFQLKDGHRFSTDDILVAWYGTTWAPTVTTALDLGSGIGTVALVAAWRLPGARFVTVEAQAESVRLARKSAQWNGLMHRFDIRQGDFREPNIFQDGERFDLILGSPPYFPRGTGLEADHPQKVACRFELRGDIHDYCAAAARQLQPTGWFACIFPVDPPSQWERVQKAALHHGLTIVRWRPVTLRDGNAPMLGLFAMTPTDALPPFMQNKTWEEPPLIIRSRDGSVHPEYSAVKMSFGFPP